MVMNPMEQYKQNAIFTATPEELTLMLYDGSIKFMNIAKYSIENNDLKKTHDSLMRAQNIVTELKITLDSQYEISANLEKLYDFILEKLIDGNIQKDTKPIDEAIEIMSGIRDAWKEAMREMKKTTRNAGNS